MGERIPQRSRHWYKPVRSGCGPKSCPLSLYRNCIANTGVCFLTPTGPRTRFPAGRSPRCGKADTLGPKTRVLQPVMVHGQPQCCSTRYKLRPQRVSTHTLSKKRTKSGRSPSFQGTLQVCRWRRQARWNNATYFGQDRRSEATPARQKFAKTQGVPVSVVLLRLRAYGACSPVFTRSPSHRNALPLSSRSNATTQTPTIQPVSTLTCIQDAGGGRHSTVGETSGALIARAMAHRPPDSAGFRQTQSTFRAFT